MRWIPISLIFSQALLCGNIDEMDILFGKARNPYLNADRFQISESFDWIPSNAWWQSFMHHRGMGWYDVEVVKSPKEVDNPTLKISLVEAESLGYENLDVGSRIKIIRDVFQGNVNQGCYYLRVRPQGLEIANQGPWAYDEQSLIATRGRSFTVGCVEGFDWNALNADQAMPRDAYSTKVIDASDLSVAVEMQTLNRKGKMTSYIVRNSPYLTFQLEGEISWYLAVPYSCQDSRFQKISSLDDSDTVFELNIEIPGSDPQQYLIFTSRPVFFETGFLDYYTIVPDREIPGPRTASFMYAEKQKSEILPLVHDGEIAIGRQYQTAIDKAPGNGGIFIPFDGKNLIVRLFRVPSKKELPAQVPQEKIKELAIAYKDIVPLGGEERYSVEGENVLYKFIYKCKSLMDWSDLDETPLIALNPPEYQALQRETSLMEEKEFSIGLRGRQELVKMSGEETMTFSLKAAPSNYFFSSDVALIADKATGINESQIEALIKQLASDVSWLNLNGGVWRYNASYEGGRELSRLALAALFFQKVLKDNPKFSSKDHEETLNSARLSLRNALTRWLVRGLVYDQEMGAVLVKTGYIHEGLNFQNVYLQDLVFHYGYFIMAASMLDQIEKKMHIGSPELWVNRPLREGDSRYAMKDLITALIRTVDSNASDDPFFPYRRSFDSAWGYNCAMGLEDPTGDGRNTESTAEDANFCFAVQMWGKAIGSKDLENFGKYLFARQANATKAYWQIGSHVSNSVYNDPALSSFTQKWPCVGILWDCKSTASNWFYSNPLMSIGIQSLNYVPTLLSYLHDPAWMKRVISDFIIGNNPERRVATWDLFKLPHEQANWATILFSAIAQTRPDLALKAYKKWTILWGEESPIFYDEGTTAGIDLFNILMCRATGKGKKKDWERLLGSIPFVDPKTYYLSPPLDKEGKVGETISEHEQKWIWNYLSEKRSSGLEAPYTILQMKRTEAAQAVLELYDQLRATLEKYPSWKEMSDMMTEEISQFTHKPIYVEVCQDDEAYTALVELCVPALVQVPLKKPFNDALPGEYR